MKASGKRPPGAISLAHGVQPSGVMRTVFVSTALGIALLGAWSVDADVPTAADFASCNAEAREALKSGSASPKTAEPNAKDHNRAADARQGGQPTDVTGKIAQSPDPQLEGMDAEGAKDPVYQAAYRTCMRKAGF
jgi:hypothetical protein